MTPFPLTSMGWEMAILSTKPWRALLIQRTLSVKTRVLISVGRKASLGPQKGPGWGLSQTAMSHFCFCFRLAVFKSWGKIKPVTTKEISLFLLKSHYHGARLSDKRGSDKCLQLRTNITSSNRHRGFLSNHITGEQWDQVIHERHELLFPLTSIKDDIGNRTKEKQGPQNTPWLSHKRNKHTEFWAFALSW